MKLVSYRTIPRVWLVNGRRWEIQFKRKITPPPGEPIDNTNSGEIIGLTFFEEDLVQIKLGLPERLLLATLIHEFIHVLEQSYGFRIPHAIIYKIDQRLADLLLDNVGEQRSRSTNAKADHRSAGLVPRVFSDGLSSAK